MMPDAPTPAVHVDSEIMSGTPEFAGTRVPFLTLLDHLEAGQPLSALLDDIPTFSEAQARAALDQEDDILLTRAHLA